jgi:NitT/TauT family transport system substrate-binding protein
MRRLISLLTGALLARGLASASAEELAVGNYGVSANGMPFGVALHKGYFQGGGAQHHRPHLVGGGGTSLRNMLAAAECRTAR